MSKSSPHTRTPHIRHHQQVPLGGVQVPHHLLVSVDSYAATQGITRSAAVRELLAVGLARGQDSGGFRELPCFNGETSAFSPMEHLLARRARVEDFCPTGAAVSPGLLRAMKNAGGTEVELRRMALVLRGMSYRQIAQHEGCIFQAIAQSIRRLNGKLAKNPEFHTYLIRYADKIRVRETPEAP